ncbi:MAG: flagellar biosynthetic protein FliO [Clostridiales bacterium]|nr:flagellar biosynthetic protein FliO [Clostridiales bacterium]
MWIRTMIKLQSTSDKELLDKLKNTTSDTVPEKISTWDNILQLLGLFIILILILIAAYYTSRFVGRAKLGQLKNSNFQVIDAYRISANKMLQIVKIANRYVVLSICKDQVTYIMELDENEVLTHEVIDQDKQSFVRIFEKIKGKKE